MQKADDLTGMPLRLPLSLPEGNMASDQQVTDIESKAQLAGVLQDHRDIFRDTAQELLKKVSRFEPSLRPLAELLNISSASR